MSRCNGLALSTLFDGELAGVAKRRTERHLAECRACQETWRFYEWLERMIQRHRAWLRQRWLVA